MGIPSCTADLQQIVRDDEHLVAELENLFYRGDYNSRAVEYWPGASSRSTRCLITASSSIADINHRLKGNMRHGSTAQITKQRALADLAGAGYQQDGENFFIANNFSL